MEVILLEAKINSLFDRLFDVECKIMSIHKSAKHLLIEGELTADAWGKLHKIRNICIGVLNKLND